MDISMSTGKRVIRPLVSHSGEKVQMALIDLINKDENGLLFCPIQFLQFIFTFLTISMRPMSNHFFWDVLSNSIDLLSFSLRPWETATAVYITIPFDLRTVGSCFTNFSFCRSREQISLILWKCRLSLAAVRAI